MKTRNDFNCNTCGVPSDVCDSQLICVAPIWELALQNSRAVANEPPTRPAVKLPTLDECFVEASKYFTSGELSMNYGYVVQKVYEFIGRQLQA